MKEFTESSPLLANVEMFWSGAQYQFPAFCPLPVSPLRPFSNRPTSKHRYMNSCSSSSGFSSHLSFSKDNLVESNYSLPLHQRDPTHAASPITPMQSIPSSNLSESPNPSLFENSPNQRPNTLPPRSTRNVRKSSDFSPHGPLLDLDSFTIVQHAQPASVMEFNVAELSIPNGISFSNESCMIQQTSKSNNHRSSTHPITKALLSQISIQPPPFSSMVGDDTPEKSLYPSPIAHPCDTRTMSEAPNRMNRKRELIHASSISLDDRTHFLLESSVPPNASLEDSDLEQRRNANQEVTTNEGQKPRCHMPCSNDQWAELDSVSGEDWKNREDLTRNHDENRMSQSPLQATESIETTTVTCETVIPTNDSCFINYRTDGYRNTPFSIPMSPGTAEASSAILLTLTDKLEAICFSKLPSDSEMINGMCSSIHIKSDVRHEIFARRAARGA